MMENQSGNAPKTTPERRAEEALAVLQKRKTAAQAAEDLGVSRKTFNEWLDKAMAALSDSMRDGLPGRPPKPPEDPEKLRLQAENNALRRENLELKGALRIREVLDGVPLLGKDAVSPDCRGSKKKA
jgi:transposase-like protein